MREKGKALLRALLIRNNDLDHIHIHQGTPDEPNIPGHLLNRPKCVISCFILCSIIGRCIKMTGIGYLVSCLITQHDFSPSFLLKDLLKLRKNIRIAGFEPASLITERSTIELLVWLPASQNPSITQGFHSPHYRRCRFCEKRKYKQQYTVSIHTSTGLCSQNNLSFLNGWVLTPSAQLFASLIFKKECEPGGLEPPLIGHAAFQPNFTCTSSNKDSS